MRASRSHNGTNRRHGSLSSEDQVVHVSHEKNGVQIHHRPSAQVHRSSGLPPPEPALEIGLFPWIFTQTVLPHSQRGSINTGASAPRYFATNGRSRLHVTSTSGLAAISHGIPYGGTCRYLIAYLCGLARKKDTPILRFSCSQSKWLADLQIGTSGGRNGRLRYIQDQLWRLTTASFRFERFSSVNSRAGVLLNAPFARRAAFWFDPVDYGSPTPFLIELDPWFFAEISRRGIPLRMATLRHLVRSPLACDLYAWLTRKVHALSEMGRPQVTISWSQLHEQFGPGYTHTRDFRKRALLQIRKIQSHWPQLQIDTPRGRLVVFSCPPHVAPAGR